ncbi:MAG: outer membrane protein assembly factor BamD [Flavobacteriaceae bacterium]|nr:outer membrane protein assembly factor BamD [Flavobacteriaceae bacterium]
MKNLVYIFLVALWLTSCGEYHKVLNKGKNPDRYKMAEKLYTEGEYKKAIALFEKLVTPYAGKPQMERIQYMIADSYYKTNDYSLSSYYFTKFLTNYSESSKVEEATFLSAKSYYLSAPKSSLDQQETNKALTAFQEFIDAYPSSERTAEANKHYQELTTRLEKKDYEIAWQFYHTENYVAAIMAFDTFNEEHLGSEFKEDAMYFKFKSAYKLGLKSSLYKKEERLENAKLIYLKFQKTFPESDKMKEMDNKLKQINKQLITTNKKVENIKKLIN